MPDTKPHEAIFTIRGPGYPTRVYEVDHVLALGLLATLERAELGGTAHRLPLAPEAAVHEVARPEVAA